MKVTIHELKGEVDVLVVASTDHVQELNHILMGGEGLWDACVEECVCVSVCVCVGEEKRG